MSKNAYVLTWDADQYPNNVTFAEISQTQRNVKVNGDWSTGRSSKVMPDDRIFLFAVGDQKGMVGSGHATSICVLKPSWKSSNKKTYYIDIEWDTLLDRSNRLTPEELSQVTSLHWERMQNPCQKIKALEQSSLEELWGQHLIKARKKHQHILALRKKIAQNSRKSKEKILSVIYSYELDPEKIYLEGSVASRVVDRYERNSTARKACLNEYGSVCCVCSFDFKKTYGPTGKGIHVHHLTELATIGKEYQLDPIEDLCPVCPNCHAMLHSTRPAMSIDELKKLIAIQTKKRRALTKLSKQS